MEMSIRFVLAFLAASSCLCRALLIIVYCCYYLLLLLFIVVIIYCCYYLLLFQYKSFCLCPALQRHPCHQISNIITRANFHEGSMISVVSRSANIWWLPKYIPTLPSPANQIYLKSALFNAYANRQLFCVRNPRSEVKSEKHLPRVSAVPCSKAPFFCR